jgi:cytochrome c oxidase subunit 2
MAITIALLLIVVASVLFHWFTPWWLTPLASNWKAMDDTLTITVIVTGAFFVAINAFLIYSVWRFRHRQGSARAAYQPENRRLERWLIGVTTVGIVAMLAPGLVVYARYLDVPRDAIELEVLGQQWQWRFRLPGAGGRLGGTDVRFVAGDNPFGIDPADAHGADDVLVTGNEVHLPLGRPVKMLLRSQDALHDFFVPHFRARMNIVPGQVSWFWFTPTQPGRYEAMCAQLCGVGHPDMRASVVVEEPAAYAAWVAAQPTFAAARAAARAEAADPVARGRALAQSKGCVACHSVDGSASVGPTWKGLYGKTETLADGSTMPVDDAFLRDFIRDPLARDIKGFPNVMPRIEMSDAEREALVAYIKAQAAR